MSKPWILASLRRLTATLLLAVGVACAGCSRRSAGSAERSAQAGSVAATATFVGRQVCSGCHEREAALWQGSHHDLSMQEAAAPGAVLGDFEGKPVEGLGRETRFFRRGKEHAVRAAGADGRPHDFAVAYTFGVSPLQQLLLPTQNGRVQALSVAWDSRPAADGGQRWFSLYPDHSPAPGDPLHWTGREQRWNSMCAECHSTGVRKGYEAASDTYKTSWKEIDVSCEGCHGPGSRHVAWARGAERGRETAPSLIADALPNKGLEVALRDPNRGAWIIDPATGSGRRTAPLSPTREIETCARCHSRRVPLREDSAASHALLDDYRPALLDAGLYHADGQIDGEVFEYGSFLQSRMYGKGITCSDCHEPHSARLRFPGNAMCGTCHSPARFDTPAHHHHAASPNTGATAPLCVDCHMPTKRYMGVDDRRDHSLRIPRPDLTLKIGTPNACNGCHAGRSPAWAASAVERWQRSGREEEAGGAAVPPASVVVGGEVPRSAANALAAGRSGEPRAPRWHWGEAIAAARAGRPEGGALLLRVIANPEAPEIARATALSLLPGYPSAEAAAAITHSARGAAPAEQLSAPAETESSTGASAATQDGDALLRLGAAIALERWPLEERAALAAPFLADPRRAVRIAAARALAPIPPAALPTQPQPLLLAAVTEYRQSLAYAADRPEARVELGTLHAQQGDLAGAEAAYRGALRLDRSFAPAWADLADLHRLRGQEDEVIRTLRAGLARAPRAAGLHHALGLALIRTGHIDQAFSPLARAVELEPGEPRYAYVYRVALHDSGRASLPTQLFHHPPSRP